MKKQGKIGLIAFATAAFGAAFAYANQWFAEVAFAKNPKKRPRGGVSAMAEAAKEGQEWLHAQKPQIVEMESSDHLKLRAHYIPCEGAKRTIIEFHGWHGSWDVDFSGSSPYLHKMGCNLLIVDQRAQGDSEGKYMTFGIRERKDVMDWVCWYQREMDPELPIYLAGLSMGASTVLMAAGDAFPPQVRGILADCGYSSAYGIMSKVSKQWFHLPEHPLMDTFCFYCKYVLKIDLKEWTVLDAMEISKLPILFIHGTGDRFVPYEMTIEAYERCISPKEILLVDGAAHGMSFVVDKEAYLAKVAAFFETNEVNPS